MKRVSAAQVFLTRQLAGPRIEKLVQCGPFLNQRVEKVNRRVLNALQQLSATRQELVQARYMYAFDRLKLKAAAGSLGESDVIEINGWMTSAAR